MGAGTALVLGAVVGACVALPAGKSDRPPLLVLRGGVQPALAAGVVNEQLLPSRISRSSRRRKNKSPSASFQVRDAVTAILCVSAVGAIAASAGGMNLDPVMAAHVPRNAMMKAWILFGGALSSGLYALVRLTNYDRARQIRGALCKTILGLDPEATGFANEISAPAILAALGAVAAFQTLPSSAG